MSKALTLSCSLTEPVGLFLQFIDEFDVLVIWGFVLVFMTILVNEAVVVLDGNCNAPKVLLNGGLPPLKIGEDFFGAWEDMLGVGRSYQGMRKL